MQVISKHHSEPLLIASVFLGRYSARARDANMAWRNVSSFRQRARNAEQITQQSRAWTSLAGIRFADCASIKPCLSTQNNRSGAGQMSLLMVSLGW